MKHIRKQCQLRCIALLVIINISASSFAFINSTHGLIILTEYGCNEQRLKTVDAEFSEKNHPVGLGAASKMFLTALYQEAAPILAPAPLLQVIFDHTKIAQEATSFSTESFLEIIAQQSVSNNSLKHNAFVRTVHTLISSIMQFWN